MKISYEATLDDVVEPSVRLFYQSKTYATNRWRGAVLCAAAFAVFAFLGFHAKENVNLTGVCLAAAAWGAGLYLLTYKGTVRRRIKTYLARELKGSWPRTTGCEIKDGMLISTTTGGTSSFALTDLTGIREDAKHLELTFGRKDLCVIPLRAFESADEKTAFLSAVNG